MQRMNILVSPTCSRPFPYRLPAIFFRFMVPVSLTFLAWRPFPPCTISAQLRLFLCAEFISSVSKADFFCVIAPRYASFFSPFRLFQFPLNDPFSDHSHPPPSHRFFSFFLFLLNVSLALGPSSTDPSNTQPPRDIASWSLHHSLTRMYSLGGFLSTPPYQRSKKCFPSPSSLGLPSFGRTRVFARFVFFVPFGPVVFFSRSVLVKLLDRVGIFFPFPPLEFP